MKIALREDMTPGDRLQGKLAWLERVGIDGIELHAGSMDLPEGELRSILDSSPVRAANLAGGMGLLDPDPRRRAESRDVTRRRLELAGELGATGVLEVPQFGRPPLLPDLSPFATALELERELLIRQLRELAPVAAAASVSLFLEPLNRYEAHLVNRVEQGVEFASQAGPGVATMADFFHMNIEEVDIAAAIRDNADAIVYVHVADSNRLQPGRGHLDFRPGFRALRDAGYDGWIGIECRVQGPFEAALAETVEHVRTLWEGPASPRP